MGLRISTNLPALNAHRTLSGTSRVLQRSLERLSSGLRINRASDDAAGLSISEVLKSQFRGAWQAVRNIQDAISSLNVADGALQEVTAIVQRMRELAVQSANGIYASEERLAMQAEVDALKLEIRGIAANTTFNNFPLLAGAGDDYVTSAIRTTTGALTRLSSTFIIDQRQDLTAVTPRTATTNTFTVDQRQDLIVVDPTVTSVGLSARPERYGLGTAGPQSIVVRLRDTASGVSRVIPYDPTNGFTYNSATNRIELNGTAVAAAGEDQLQVDFVRQGALSFSLSGAPITGSDTLTVNGAPVARSTTNGYSITGTTLRLNGNARPTAGVPTTVTANYDTGTTFVTLSARPEQYGLGTAGPQSIVVRLRNTGTGVTRVIPYDPVNGFTYVSGTNRIMLNGTAIPGAGENQVQVDFVRQGALSLSLASAPIAGTESVSLNGAPLAADPTNGYAISGSTLLLNGASRPTAGTATTVAADYLPAGTTTLSLDSSNPFFLGAILNAGSISIMVDGVPQSFVEGVDYTIQEVRTDSAGLTPLYAYSVVLQNTAIAAVATSASPSVSVDYTVDYPTTYGPFELEIQSGANQGQSHTIGLDRINVDSLGLVTTDLSTQAGAMAGLTELDGALAKLAEIRGRYGADQNRLGHTLTNMTNAGLQMETANSRLRDADMAAEMSALTRHQILMQSGTAMLEETNLAPSQILSLLEA